MYAINIYLEEKMKQTKFVIVCFVIVAICFGIISYGHFNRGQIASGSLFAVLSAAEAVIAVLQFIKNRNNR